MEQKSSENSKLTSKLTHTLHQLEATEKEARKLKMSSINNKSKFNEGLELRDQQYSSSSSSSDEEKRKRKRKEDGGKEEEKFDR